MTIAPHHMLLIPSGAVFAASNAALALAPLGDEGGPDPEP